ncbi:MAG: TIGR01459 family HAD-type hydrolase [Mangrovicoccus sp.]
MEPQDRLCPPERRVNSLVDISANLSAIFFDQFGVLHDGFKAYPTAITCCEALAKQGKPLVLISNSGKRAARNQARLATLGFDPAWFASVITSGELAFHHLSAALATGELKEGAKILLLSRGGDTTPLDGLPLQASDDPVKADLFLIAGIEADLGLTHYQKRIAEIAPYNLPALCINPDTHSFTPDGVTFGPGRLAMEYRALGGDVTFLGKPHLSVFEAARAAVGKPAAAECLMVGDSLLHDIEGAHAAGLQTCLIAAGVFGEDSEALKRAPLPDYWMEVLA